MSTPTETSILKYSEAKESVYIFKFLAFDEEHLHTVSKCMKSKVLLLASDIILWQRRSVRVEESKWSR